jgi:hypothetical protein
VRHGLLGFSGNFPVTSKRRRATNKMPDRNDPPHHAISVKNRMNPLDDEIRNVLASSTPEIEIKYSPGKLAVNFATDLRL